MNVFVHLGCVSVCGMSSRFRDPVGEESVVGKYEKRFGKLIKSFDFIKEF